MQEFGEKYHLSLGEHVTRKLLHEGHRLWRAAFVLEASIAVSWCFPGDPTEDTPYSRRILALLATHDAVAPEIWAFEVANTVFVSFVKRKRITEPVWPNNSCGIGINP